MGFRTGIINVIFAKMSFCIAGISFDLAGSGFRIGRKCGWRSEGFAIPLPPRPLTAFAFPSPPLPCFIARLVTGPTTFASKLRALLVLGRVSNLPTVWSNCLAGWLLGGGGAWGELLKLSAGATLVYVGGMYLNDAFDADFDRKFRRERPVPAGAVGEVTVWACGLGWLFAGGLILALPDWENAIYAALLVMSVLVYNAVHKHVSFAPVLMAGCRVFLYLLACSAGSVGVTGLGIWSGLVLGAYIVGLSYLARREATLGAFQWWPLLLLAAPLVLAVIVNDFEHRQSALMICSGMSAWILWSLRHTLTLEPPDIGRTVGGLLAGIPLVDLLAVGWNTPDIAAQSWTGLQLVGVFVGLFLLAKLAQRVVPAT